MKKQLVREILVSVIPLLLSAAMLAGCSSSDNHSSLAESDATDTATWKTDGFALSKDIEERQELWVTEFIPWTHEDVIFKDETEDLFTLFGDPPCRILGEKIYRLNTVCNPPVAKATRWILEIYDTAAMSSAVREFSYEQLEQAASGNCYLTAIDLVDEDNFVFQWEIWETDADQMISQTASRMIYTDLQKDSYAVDLWDIYLEKGIAQAGSNPYLLLGPGYCVCDGAGNTYQKAGMGKFGYTKLYVMDRNGAVLLEYEGAPEHVIEEPMRVESGELIYPVYDMRESCYYFLWPDTETGEALLLGTMDASVRSIKQLFGMQGNLIYYETAEGIVAWDIKSGARTLIFNYQENGIPRTFQTMLVFRNEQPPLLRLYRSSEEGVEDWLAPLSYEPVQRENTLQVANLVNPKDDVLGSKQVSECAGLASRKDMNHAYFYQTADLDADAFRTQIMAELMAGKGPDLLYVTRSDMALLQELGLLADLRELIPAETLDDLWPGVISMGTLDEQLVGLPGNITSASGLAVSGDTWSEDTWRLEDIISLMEEGRLENAIYYPGPDFYLGPVGTARWLLEYSLADSFLIDWEHRESRFEDERFVRLLEITKDSRDALSDDSESWFHGGKSLVLVDYCSYAQMNTFDVMADREGGRYVGFPTQGGSGNYLEASGMLVVTVNAKDTKGIEAYLEYFLGDQIQDICQNHTELTNSVLSVRRFHEDEIELSPEGEYLWRGKKLSVLQDGSTSLQRAISFLESCIPAPTLHPELMKIISEELEAFYAGDKSARQTAEIIDGRIQVYLDEENY